MSPNTTKMPDLIEPNGRTEDGENDPHYEPIVSLPLVNVPTMEEDEVEMCKVRARLYRFDKADHEWKERGTGDIKLLHHMAKGTVRVVMRRDKTLKLCANHFITDDMNLQPHIGSERAFNWTALGDFADETAKQEFLAIKFGNIENASIWKTKFNEALEIVKARKISDTNKTADGEESTDRTSSPSSLSSNNSSSENSISSEQKPDKVIPEESNEAQMELQLSHLKLESDKETTDEKKD